MEPTVLYSGKQFPLTFPKMPKMHSELNFRYTDVLAPAGPGSKWTGAAAAVWQESRAAAGSCCASLAFGNWGYRSARGGGKEQFSEGTCAQRLPRC